MVNWIKRLPLLPFSAIVSTSLSERNPSQSPFPDDNGLELELAAPAAPDGFTLILLDGSVEPFPPVDTFVLPVEMLEHRARRKK